jgi:hypothetical protein
MAGRARASADAFFRHQRRHGIGVSRVKRLHRVCDGIDAGRCGEARWQRQGEVDIVDHGLRQHRRIAHRGLQAVLGLAEDRRHLRAGIGGGDAELVDAGAKRQRLAEARRGSAAERNDAVGVARLHRRERALRDLDRGVHGRAGKDAGIERAERGSQALALRLLLRRRQHQGTLAGETLNLGLGRGQRSAAEHDAAGQVFEGERTDHAPVSLMG